MANKQDIPEQSPTTGSKKYSLLGVSTFGRKIGLSEGLELQVPNLYLNIPDMLLSSDVSQAFEKSVEQVIQAFATNRGYPTDLKASTITNYLKEATLAFGVLAKIWQSQSAVKLRDSKGRSISTLFTYRVPVVDPLEDLAMENKEIISVSNENISNAVWARDYAGATRLMYLPDTVVNLLLEMLLPVFTLDSFNPGAGHTTLLNIFPAPEEIIGNGMVPLFHQRCVENLEDLIFENPDLIPFMTFMGFTNEHAIAVDFTRDIHAQTLYIKDDPEFLQQLVNAKVFWPYNSARVWGNQIKAPSSDNDYASLYLDFDNYEATVFNNEDVKTFDGTENTISLLFNEALIPGTHKYAVLSSRTLSLTDTGQVVLAGLRTPNVRWSHGEELNDSTVKISMLHVVQGQGYYNIPSPVQATMILKELNAQGVPILVEGFEIEATTLDSLNTFSINLGDAAEIRQILALRLWLGNDYRQELQLKIARSFNSRTGGQ